MKGRFLERMRSLPARSGMRPNPTPSRSIENDPPLGPRHRSRIRRRDVTIYACPTCETRYHGEQWCHDCNQPCTRVGLGGLCPRCAEPVAISDLIDTLQATPNC
jgi:hypothetical protein